MVSFQQYFFKFVNHAETFLRSSDGSNEESERVRLLQKELEEQARLHREVVGSMDADRKLLTMERDAERLRDADELRCVTQRYFSSIKSSKEFACVKNNLIVFRAVGCDEQSLQIL